MNYMSPKEAAEKWGITQRRVTVLCNEARINHVTRVGNAWLIPKNADKPEDARKNRYTKKLEEL